MTYKTFQVQFWVILDLSENWYKACTIDYWSQGQMFDPPFYKEKNMVLYKKRVPLHELSYVNFLY